jgi:hypothetical protein
MYKKHLIIFNVLLLIILRTVYKFGHCIIVHRSVSCRYNICTVLCESGKNYTTFVATNSQMLKL